MKKNNIHCALFAALALSMPIFGAEAKRQRAEMNINNMNTLGSVRAVRMRMAPDASIPYTLKEAETFSFEIRARGYAYGRLYNGGEDVVIFSPSNVFKFSISAEDASLKTNPLLKAGANAAHFEDPSYAELYKYRDIAMNPCGLYANRAGSRAYPQASASSAYKNKDVFLPQNAISANTQNAGHGTWQFRSWGPEREEVSSIKIDFGRLVSLNKVRLLLRADFPHDGVWAGGVLKFSDGSSLPLKFEKTAEFQEFAFPEKETTFIELAKLKPATGEGGWCALSALQAWGRDALPFDAYNKDGALRPFADALADFELKKGMYADEVFIFRLLSELYPIEANQLLRDAGGTLKELMQNPPALRAEFVKKCALMLLSREEFPQENKERFEEELHNAAGVAAVSKVYANMRAAARQSFIKRMEAYAKSIVFTERLPNMPSFYAYTEGLSDGRGEVSFAPSSRLVKLTLEDGGKVCREVLLEDLGGVIRDPDISYDARRVLFSHKKSALQDDFHIYEMDLETRVVRQLTRGDCADTEAKYMRGGDIVFNSSRCEQGVDCYNTDVSNLYIMDAQGRYMRRVGFDQVHTTSPSVLEDGRIVYTRWDYSDRGQTFTQGLFLMNPDGTFQTELYGNKSWYPTSILHARQIPGTMKFAAIFSGHHTPQKGKLGLIDPSCGRQENSGAFLLAPLRKEEPVRLDVYGQRGAQFAYPFAFSENLYLVSACMLESLSGKNYPVPFGLFLIDAGGFYELLSADKKLSSFQAAALEPRKDVPPPPSRVDYTKENGALFIRNIYFGAGVEGIAKGSIEKVRVIKLEYKRAPVGYISNINDEGGVLVEGHSFTPISLGGGAWGVKEILGEVPVEPDGSVYFEVPAHTPVYFQPIDKEGRAVTTMRSWTVMQPGEFYSCLGCHGDRDTPHKAMLNIDPARKPAPLRPFYDVQGGFSFKKVIQPILNARCISCHFDRSAARVRLFEGGKTSVGALAPLKDEKLAAYIESRKDKEPRAFSLLDAPVPNLPARREFNDAYYNLLCPSTDKHGQVSYADFTSEIINWPGAQSVPTILPPYFRGSAKSKIMQMLKDGHGGVNLTREELDKIAAWIDLYVPYSGDYRESALWSADEENYYFYYEQKAANFKEEQRRNLEEYSKAKTGKEPEPPQK